MKQGEYFINYFYNTKNDTNKKTRSICLEQLQNEKLKVVEKRLVEDIREGLNIRLSRNNDECDELVITNIQKIDID